MDLQAHYTQLWEQAQQEFATGNFALDPLLDSPHDTRRGITLLARPNAAVKREVQDLLRHLAQVEPDQYYYPASDMHLTVLSIISCYPGFSLEHIRPAAYAELIEKALRSIAPFKVVYSGITASPSCVLVQGYPVGPALELLRDNVRKAFRASGLQQSIDERYTLQTAHSTVVRFRAPLKRPTAFLQKLRECRKREFGTSTVHTLELVYHDWYQRQANTQLLATFPLG
ncbi:2'-5' RNA ligase family protein [Rufibacter psychrotolerans]|uniref:2'-5' RNA ligase family protein n=1 Tax=Rufibacter psychrotolerans TaxID=2812556 RepID=UPI0019687426|nr:mutarotase [Rufibacter sp. SYSU D00308]